MKILLVTQRCCIRTRKQAIALSQHNEVHLVSKNIPQNEEVFTTITHYFGDEKTLADALSLYKFVDIVYATAEPHWVVAVIHRILPDKKIILDVHDSMIWRSTELTHRSAEERLVYNWVDALVVPSNSGKKIIRKTFELKVPIEVLPPYANEVVYQMNSWAWRGGIVYQGRIDLPSAPSFMDYDKYEELFTLLQKEEIPVHVYMPGSDNKKWRKIYEPICIWHNGLSYLPLIQSLGFYDWGLCGNLKKFREWDIAMPNKLFDYLAGGIPIIALNAKETGDFVEKHGFGISVSSIEEIKKRWDERDRCQKNVFLKRYDFTMEKHIHIVEDLCRRLLS